MPTDGREKPPRAGKGPWRLQRQDWIPMPRSCFSRIAMPPSSPPGTWSWWTTTRMLSTCASEGPRLHQMCSWTWSAMQYHTGWRARISKDSLTKACSPQRSDWAQTWLQRSRMVSKGCAPGRLRLRRLLPLTRWQASDRDLQRSSCAATRWELAWRRCLPPSGESMAWARGWMRPSRSRALRLRARRCSAEIWRRAWTTSATRWCLETTRCLA
mmetsp:Transcript_959/g.4051  ORF Transcript_959/g.4051 Transcript_959/m.4051 type:complete len:213 (+) Transcript_959:763-1401(+)